MHRRKKKSKQTLNYIQRCKDLVKDEISLLTSHNQILYSNSFLFF